MDSFSQKKKRKKRGALATVDGHSHVKKISKRWPGGLSLKQSRCSVCHLPPAAHPLLRLLAGSRPRLGYLSFWGSSILFGLLTDHFLSEQTSKQLMLRLNTFSRALLRKIQNVELPRNGCWASALLSFSPRRKCCRISGITSIPESQQPRTRKLLSSYS